MAESSALFPWRDPVTEPDRTVSDRWKIWFRDLHQQINAGAVRLASVTPDPQTGAIATTPFDTAALASGVYRFSSFAHVTTAAGVSSSLQVSVHFTQDGDALSFTGTLQNGNTTAVVDSNTWNLLIDENTPISYSVAYTSNPANAMTYMVAFVLESVSVA